MQRIALLGTGLLGSGMVQRFLRSGTAVTVWNRTESKARALAQHGALVAASPREAAGGAMRVHLVLPDDAVVNQILQQIETRRRLVNAGGNGTDLRSPGWVKVVSRLSF